MQYLIIYCISTCSCYAIVKSYAVLFLPADECPDDKYLNKYVRKRVCAAGTDKWQDLGIALMGQDAVYVLDIIKINHPNCIERCCTRMFTVWRQRTPKASWKQLIESLKEVELTQLASDLEELLQPAMLEEQSALVTNEKQQSLTHFKFKGIIAQKFNRNKTLINGACTKLTK